MENFFIHNIFVDAKLGCPQKMVITKRFFFCTFESLQVVKFVLNVHIKKICG